MISTSMLYQRMFHAQRMGQLSGAAAIVRTLLCALLVSPLIGWLFSALQGFHATLRLPWSGTLVIGAYRFVYALQFGFALLSLAAIRMARRHWLKLGGPDHYESPL